MDYTCCSLQLILAFILLFASSSSSTAKKAPYPTFAKDAIHAPVVTSYDYIVVGGGTSGCPLAATLSQGAKVLVLERGDIPYGIPSINNINGFFHNLANLDPTSPSQTFVSTDGVINHRARILGGGSSLNAGFFSRASPEYIKKARWDPNLVKESYAWVEKKLVFEPHMLEWQTAVKNGLLEAKVYPDNGFTYDHVYGTKVGGSIFDKTGKRHSAVDLLEYAEPSNITIYLNAMVHQILFSTNHERRVRGVLYQDRKGKTHMAMLNEDSILKNEVILSTGTIGSPQLLMLSGIGPSKHLISHGIEVVLDQPLVGQGLSDNPMNMILFPSKQALEMSLVEAVGITGFGSFIEAVSIRIDFPLLLQFHSECGLFGNETLNLDEIEYILGDHHLNVDLTGLNTGVIFQKVTGPFSAGVLELKTLSPYDNPEVTFNYYKDPRDLQTCVQGMETLIKVFESKAMSKFRIPNLSVNDLLALVVALPINLRPKHVNTAFDLKQYCKDTVQTLWHYHGGCQTGRVVDRNYKVIGVDALRVIDSSTLLDSPGTNPQATMMMLGRYMGIQMLRERLAFDMK